MDQTSRRRRTSRATAVFVLIANAGVITSALALTPLGTAFTYQGQLKNNGSPASGAFNMAFALFDAATAGAQIGPTLVCDGSAGNPPPVTVSGGVFTVTLDFGATPYTTNEARWLEVTVNSTPLTPRQPLTAAPFSLATRGIDVDVNGNLGIGAPTSPSDRVRVETSSGNAVSATTNDPSSGVAGVAGRTTSTTNGAAGVTGSALGLTGATYAVSGINSSSAGTGVLGLASSGAGTTFGVYGRSSSTSGIGVAGRATADVGVTMGVYGMAISSAGYAGYFDGRGYFRGALGIGVTTPNSETTVHVRNSTDDNFGVLVDSAGVDGSQIGLHANTAGFASLAKNAFFNGSWQRFNNNDGAFLQQVQPSGETHFRIVGPGNGAINWTDALVMRTDGFLGIGTSTPIGSANFVVSQNTSGWGGMYVNTSGATGLPFYGYAQNNGAIAYHYIDGADGNKWKLYNGGVRLTVASSGDVGIGTMSPAARLDVAASTSDGIRAASTAQYGYGVNASGISGGVYGESRANGGFGVVGSSDSGAGVYGESISSSAIYGLAIGSGYAGYFQGRVNVTGTLSKGGGSFKIDHPLDPENKYLYHSFVESPDMMNIYNGNITTDAKGEAEVVLPDWFEPLNRDFRYQLTVLDESRFAQARISRKIHDHRFSIMTDRPNMEVSWQVTGIRHDAFANAHRIPVEEAKDADERGLYLYPQEHGQPIDRLIDQARRTLPVNHTVAATAKN